MVLPRRRSLLPPSALHSNTFNLPFSKTQVNFAAMAIVESTMSFLQPWDVEKGNPYVRGAPAEGFETLNYSNQEYEVKITDARPNKGEYTIDTHGFAYHDDPYVDEAVLEVLRANDKAEVSDRYYPMVERLVKEKTGATKVVVFDHTLRRRQPALAKTDNPNGKEQPASLVGDGTKALATAILI